MMSGAQQIIKAFHVASWRQRRNMALFILGMVVYVLLVFIRLAMPMVLLSMGFWWLAVPLFIATFGIDPLKRHMDAKVNKLIT